MADLVKKLKVLYLGTATYDLQDPFDAQAGWFVKMGANVTKVDVANEFKHLGREDGGKGATM